MDEALERLDRRVFEMRMQDAVTELCRNRGTRRDSCRRVPAGMGLMAGRDMGKDGEWWANELVERMECRDREFAGQMATFGRRSDALAASVISLQEIARQSKLNTEILIDAVADLGREVRELKEIMRRK